MNLTASSRPGMGSVPYEQGASWSSTPPAGSPRTPRCVVLRSTSLTDPDKTQEKPLCLNSPQADSATVRVVKHVLITGMSGAGKSSLLGELAARGYRTVDTDYGDYHETVDGEWLWREDRRGPRAGWPPRTSMRGPRSSASS
jgi:hypothetical protein